MTKRSLSLKWVSISLLIYTVRAVWTLPASTEVDLVQHTVQEEEEEGHVVTNEKDHDDGNPIYEFQLAVWPDDDNDLESEHNAINPWGVSSSVPQFEDQEVVFPDSIIPTWLQPATVTKPPTPSDLPQQNFDHDDDDNDNDVDDNDVDHSLIGDFQGVGVTHKPVAPMPHAEVVEQYQTVHPNGTTEYKLVLSNGMTNYKKIYNKLMADGKIVTVQEGYDSVPIPGDDPYANEFQTQFYIADEHGHNVYSIKRHTQKPRLPQYLDYKLQKGIFE